LQVVEGSVDERLQFAFRPGYDNGAMPVVIRHD
jgi:hypothetical protein